MGFQNTSSTNHIKFLTLATLFVCMWFIFTVPGSSNLPSNLHIPGKSSHKGKKPSPLDLLPLDEAKLYCEQRRWKPYPYRQAPRKIYDLVMINTELEWLEIRMGQMVDQVDYFVILESDKTFTNQEKPLYVQENMERFKKYRHKMIVRTLDLEELGEEGTWAKERFSRNAMYEQVIPDLTGAQQAFQGDVILVSDVDEIPRPDALKALRNCDFPKEVTMHTKMYYYGFQWQQRTDWGHPQATFFDGEKTILPDALRGTQNAAHLYNAGWHCSYCFPTVHEMVTKIKSFSHTEMDREEFTDRNKIVERVRNGRDMFDRDNEHYDRVEENLDVPDFMKRNPERYKYMLDRDPLNANFVDYSPEEAKAYQGKEEKE
ncbi:family 17 glycosyltransferase [Halenospora varia]|nr:family 17 glycosyltransferase [Halenospora varia]